MRYSNMVKIFNIPKNFFSKTMEKYFIKASKNFRNFQYYGHTIWFPFFPLLHPVHVIWILPSLASPCWKAREENIYSVSRTTERAFRAQVYVFVHMYRVQFDIFGAGSSIKRRSEREKKRTGAANCGVTFPTTPSMERPRGVRVTPFRVLPS